MDHGGTVVCIDTLLVDGAAHLIWHPVDAGQGFDFEGLSLYWAAILAAVPDLLSIDAVQPDDLAELGKGVGPDPADNDVQTGIKFIGGRWL